MWKEYSKSYLKNNRASSFSIMAAALIAALFLSLLCSLAFNFWTYEVERIKLEEGDWQGRITGDLGAEDLETIRQFANVENVVVNESLSTEEDRVLDIYFKDIGTIYRDMPLIARQLGVTEEQMDYHELLLSRYFVTDPQDDKPPLLLPFYAVLLMVVSISLILIIRNSFEISMQARIHQFGILSSIGATPRQIRICLLQEAAVLSLVPVLAGSLMGIGISYAVIEAINDFASDVAGRHQAVFQYHPMVFASTFLSSALTVFFSAWIPAKKLGKITPLEAIRNTGGMKVKRKVHAPILSNMFGIRGELAGNALKTQKKSLRIANVSLLLSFLGFTAMLCFFTLSEISTRYTYFERYQDVWDVMVTVKDTGLADFAEVEKIKELPDIQSCIIYQKAEASCQIEEQWQSDELLSLGGIETAAGSRIARKGDNYQVKAPIIIMDDESFFDYCRQIGQEPNLSGTIALNRIWDSTNSHFRNKKYVPFVKEEKQKITLYAKDRTPVHIPVLAYTQKVPALREEYENYAFVQFMPLSFWRHIADQIDGERGVTYIRILGKDGIRLEECYMLEQKVTDLLEPIYDVESENRIQEQRSNKEMIQGAKAILRAFCGLLALIGIANIFSNTLGFLRQRRREFAQYLSIGMTPNDMRIMFCIEAAVIVGRPILLTLPLTAIVVAWMLAASHLDPMIFLQEAPAFPVTIFALMLVGFVALAYYLGGRRMFQCDLGESLKDDTMI